MPLQRAALALAGSLCVACASQHAVDSAPVEPVSAAAHSPVQAKPASPPTARHVDGNAFEVAVSGSGPPVILIPGLTCGAHVWDATVERLAGRYELHVLTLSGFAGRPPIEGPLLSTVRDEIVAYADKAGLQRPALVGHSLGGFMVLWLAASEPDRFGAVAAVDGLPSLAAAVGLDEASVGDAAAKMRAQMASLSPTDFAAGTEQSLSAQIRDPEDVAWVAEVSGRSSPAAVGLAMEEMLVRDIRPMMEDVRSPVLLLGPGVGSDEHKARTQAIYREQVAPVPEHRVVFLDGARHFVMLDAPEAFARELDSFLDEHRREPTP